MRVLGSTGAVLGHPDFVQFVESDLLKDKPGNFWKFLEKILLKYYPNYTVSVPWLMYVPRIIVCKP